VSEIMKFEFKNNENLECVELNGEPLFDPLSVGTCLNIGENTVRGYVSEMNDKQRINVRELSRNKKFSLKLKKGDMGIWITESGLYQLIFKSRKPEAQTFVAWVTDEVLPSIRKTGRYEIQSKNRVTQELLQGMMENIKKITGVQPEELARVQNESYRAKLANLLNDVSKRDKVGTPFLYEKLYFLFAGETGFLIPELAKKAGISNSAYLKQHELSAKMLYEFALAYFYKDKRVVELIKLSPDQRTLAEF